MKVFKNLLLISVLCVINTSFCMETKQNRSSRLVGLSSWVKNTKSRMLQYSLLNYRTCMPRLSPLALSCLFCFPTVLKDTIFKKIDQDNRKTNVKIEGKTITDNTITINFNDGDIDIGPHFIKIRNSQKFQFLSSGAITTQNECGSIIAQGHDNEQFLVKTMYHANSQEDIKRLQQNTTINVENNTAQIQSKIPDGICYNCSVDFELLTPRQVSLNAKTNTGSINTKDISQVTAQTTIGDIKLENVDEATAKSGRGAIEITQANNAQGNIFAKAKVGSISINNLINALTARTICGSITVQKNKRQQGKIDISSKTGHTKID